MVHQSMRIADKPHSNIVLVASHMFLMYLNDNVYILKKQEVVQPSCRHVMEHFLIWTLPLDEKLGLQLSNNKPKCILALLYARRSCINNNMVWLCHVAPGYLLSSSSDSSPSVSVFIPLRSPLKSSISSSETVGTIETLAFCLLHVG